MKELTDIVQAYDAARRRNLGCVLATVVHVEGSSYRRPGARMLVSADGRLNGSISGGCLEGDALKKALLALSQRQNKLVTYDTSDEDDAVLGVQLGCNGIIQVLLEPIDERQPDNPVELLRAALEQDKTCVAVTLFHWQKDKSQPGTRAVFDGDGFLLTPSDASGMPAFLSTDVLLALEENRSRMSECLFDGASHPAFIEVIQPPPHLVLVGAGNDAQPPAQMAALLGWKVSVVDGRPAQADARRFEPGCQVILARPDALLEKIRMDRRTAVVLMTHNYPYDLAALRVLIAGPDIPYIGILGPRKKYLRMLDDLRQEGVAPTPEQSTRIYAPIGFDLGAENAAEIGLSVLSEILAVLNAREGGHLRARREPIHPASMAHNRT